MTVVLDHDLVAQDVRRISDPGRLADVLTVQQQVWDDDFSWLGEYLGGALTRFPDQMSVYVAYVDDQPASAAWTMRRVCDSFIRDPVPYGPPVQPVLTM